MSPFLSYSGRGRGRGGRGRGGRGREKTIDRRTNISNHKWVRPPVLTEQTDSGAKNNEEEESKLKILPGSSGKSGTESKQEKKKDEPAAISTFSHRIMKRSGQHKLVLSSKANSRPVASGCASGDSWPTNESQSQTKPATQTLTREGRNKLVSLANSNLSKQMEQKKSLNSHPMSRCKGYGGRKNNSTRVGDHTDRRTRIAPPSTTRLRPTAKRIKLSIHNADSTKGEKDNRGNEFQESSNCANQSLSLASATPADTHLETKPIEKLSDFAYKEVSRVKQRPSGRSLHWSKCNSESSDGTHSEKTSTLNSTTVDSKLPKMKNMGLVRVHPNAKTTPICPAFLRGLPCQDQFCRKRHDIPKEFAMPVCSFFQRHGQCLKESCVFRHIKLNPKALVCPSFAMLGFCEDKECKMQHVRGPLDKSALGVNAPGKEKPTSRFNKKKNNVYYRNKFAGDDR